MTEIVFVDELERDRNAVVGVRLFAGRAGEALIAQIDASSKVNSKRIGSSETMVVSSVEVGTVAAGHQIADRDAAVADAAVDRRAQIGIFVEVELGLMDHRLLRRDAGFRHALRLFALIEDLLGHRLVAHQLLAAGEIGFGER